MAPAAGSRPAITPPAERLETGDLVLDVSLSCAWCFADEASEGSWALLSRLQTVEAHVPSLWLWETAYVLLQAEQGDRITAAAIRTVLGLLEALPIRIDPAGTATICHDTLALARAHRLTSSDAADLELAHRLGLPLASLDQALQAAATFEGVPLLPTGWPSELTLTPPSPRPSPSTRRCAITLLYRRDHPAAARALPQPELAGGGDRIQGEVGAGSLPSWPS